MSILLQNWWYTTLLEVTAPMNPPLKSDIKADVVIIGAGAAGLSAAYTLMDKGLKVVVLEKNICGGSSTGKSAGFLTPDSELELSQLLRRFGKDGARDIWEVATTGVKMIVDRVHTHNFKCDLIKQDSLFLANNPKDGWQQVKEEADARREMNYTTELYDRGQVKDIVGGLEYYGAVRYPDTYGIDALRYSQEMKKILMQKGIEIYEASEVVSVKGHTVSTHLGSVTADQIIFCADKLKENITEYAWSTYHAQTFLSISEPLSEGEIKQMFPYELFQCWDTDLIYSYYRLTGEGRLLLGGGSAFTTYSKNDVRTSYVIDEVIGKFKKKYPFLKNLEFIQFWPGRIDMTRDLLPTILRDEKSSWIHFVLGCVGLPWATFCGNFVARHVINDKAETDHKYYRYFSIDRGFLLPVWMEKIFGKKIIFSLNNGWAKYYQKDKGKKVPYKDGQF